MPFKKGLVPTLVGVVTTMYEGRVNAAPVTWFMPVSYDPPIVAISLKPDNDTVKNIQEKEEFVLQTVPYNERQRVHNLAESLPRDESEVCKQGLSVNGTDMETVRLNCAIDWYACKAKAMIEVGDHIVVFGDVVSMYEESNPEKLFYSGGLRYTKVKGSVEVEPY